jgi:hypothetical protein
MPHAPPKWGIVFITLGTLLLSACGGVTPAAAPTAAPLMRLLYPHQPLLQRQPQCLLQPQRLQAPRVALPAQIPP